MHQYVLTEDGKPVIERDLNKWGQFMADGEKRRVAQTSINGANVSTVFLGLDHGYSFGGEGNPILWETMIFGGEHDGWMDRYDSVEAAKKGHDTAVAMVKEQQSH